MTGSPAPFHAKPIVFGTDGWRGVIAAEFTFERVARVAPIAAQILKETYGESTGSNTVIVGYDRRFMAEDFARVTADSVAAAGFDVLLSASFASTPAFSWAAKYRNALGAIVLTASHNPAKYLGLKVKGAFGGSAPPEITQQIEARLDLVPEITATPATPGTIETFDPWPEFVADLRTKANIEGIRAAIASGKLTVFVDVMHGSAAGGVGKILDAPVHELNSDRDPLFAGGAPEPLPKYLPDLLAQVKAHGQQSDGLTVGLVFDGDGDRIAAVDGQGNFLSSQILIPILLQHLAERRGLRGELVKTISGSDLMPRIAKLYDLPVFETPVGYKYIADRMLSGDVLLGGEESGGIGYNTHIPERDALLSALYVLEAVVESGQDLGDLYRSLQDRADFHSSYDRIDLPLASMDVRAKLLDRLATDPPTQIAGKAVTNMTNPDGYKFRVADDSWLLIRFSGTEPVLRLYCEAMDLDRVKATLEWARDWANSVA
jgi:phosphomannomutase